MQGINADKWTINKGTYSIVPEVVDDKLVKSIVERNKEEDLYSEGWTHDRSMQRIGTVPYSVYYNFALSNGISNNQIHEWYTIDKGKNMVRLLKEFPAFRVGDNL